MSRYYKPATLHNTKAGDTLLADDGFTCIPGDGEVVVQQADDERLYVPCSEGRHYLEGQLNDEMEYVGFLIKKEKGK